MRFSKTKKKNTFRRTPETFMLERIIMSIKNIRSHNIVVKKYYYYISNLKKKSHNL